MTDALSRASEIYANYGQRAREVSQSGRGVVGYLCALTPLEIIRAAGFMPLRIKGFPETPVSEADAEMETIICSVVRAWYDAMRKDRYDFLEGLVIPHACDSMVRTYDVWANTLQQPFVSFIDIPHAPDGGAPEFFKAVLNTFRQSLADQAGHDISDGDLRAAVRDANRYQAAVQRLYELRREHPPRLSGVEATTTLVAGLGLPLDEALGLVEAITDEVKARPTGNNTGRPRLMLFGAEQDSVDFVKTVEDAGADVVVDYFCPGLREYAAIIPETPDPLDGIAAHYLGINCARTCAAESTSADPESRFGEVLRAAREYHAQGVILMIRRYCDPFGFEVPALKRYLEQNGLPTLYLEEEYAPVAARLATRIQAFLEMLPKGKS